MSSKTRNVLKSNANLAYWCEMILTDRVSVTAAGFINQGRQVPLVMAFIIKSQRSSQMHALLNFYLYM